MEPPVAKIPKIELTFSYAAPPVKVFAALTEADQLARWFVQGAVTAPRKGGVFRLTWGAYTMRGRVRSIDPPRKVVLDWVDRFEDGREVVTKARFDLQKKGKGTLLTITHSGFKDGKRSIALFGGIRSGWAYYLTNLRSVLDHGTDLRTEHDRLG